MNQDKLDELKKRTIIASTGSSMRLAGSKVTNEKVKEIMEGNRNKKKKIYDIK